MTGPPREKINMFPKGDSRFRIDGFGQSARIVDLRGKSSGLADFEQWIVDQL